MMKASNNVDGTAGKLFGLSSRSFGVERKARSAPSSPAFDPELLDAFRKALDELAPDSPPPDFVRRGGNGDGDVEKREIRMFLGIVRARVSLLQEKINAKTKLATKASPPPPPPESAGRVVVYLTSLRGIRQTYKDCWSTSAVLHSYGVRVDERDLSMHAGFKDELRAALTKGCRLPLLPQVFIDGRHLGGAEEVRRLHEAGELAAALEACESAAAGCGSCCATRALAAARCSWRTRTRTAPTRSGDAPSATRTG
uniref:Glutaredoxin domain-containing protein n=1 Tax=Dichanthelium oligosanthes TaxID=888268 RepID=A0A1E5UY68_9POAL